MWVHNWFFLNTYTYTHTYSVTSKPNNVVLEKACVICCKLLSTQEFRLQQGTHFIQIRSYFSFLCMCLLWSDQKLTDCFSSCISNPNGRKSVYPHTQKKKNHLFHWTKKSFSLLNVLPLTGEVMCLDHEHLHAAVNQECHIPHGVKNTEFLILSSVKQDT